MCVERWNLDNGISDGEVALVPWEKTVDGPSVVGAGRMSVVGLHVEGIPFDFELDYSKDPAGLDGYVGRCSCELHDGSCDL